MREKRRKLYGLERIPDNSLMVVYGDEVVVAVARNVVAVDDVAIVATADGGVVAFGVAAAVVVVFWV